MRILYRAIAVLTLLIAPIFSPAVAADPYGPYTEKEFKCLARALWHEGGSTYATLEEQRDMAYSIVVRSKFTDWYQRKDFGGPNICEVIHKKENNVCQFSFYCTAAALTDPVADKIWEMISDFMYPFVAKPKSRELWEISKRAAREVLSGTYVPPDNLKNADTYWHKCGVGLVVENCSPKLLASQRTKCWFKLEQVMLEGQVPVPENQKHVFFRRKTLEEVKATIDEVPPECRSDDPATQRKMDKTMQIVREAQREWVNNPDRSFVEKKPEVEKPKKSKKKRYFKRKKKRSRG